MPSKHTKVQKEEICNLFPEKSVKELSAIYDCAETTIRKCLRDNGISPAEVQKKNAEDLSGQQFGKLTVIKRGPPYIQKRGDKEVRLTQYWCKCSCGNPNLKLLKANTLKTGSTKSCGCGKGNQKDLIGLEFGKFKVIKRGPNGRKSNSRWWVKCSCGNPTLLLRYAEFLKTGEHWHCGCENSIEVRRNEHIKKLKLLGKVELVGDYLNESTSTTYRCLEHNEIHPSLPSNVVTGHGLKCCHSSAVNKTAQRLRDEGLNKLISFCKRKGSQIEYVDGYVNTDTLANFRCRIHDQIHPANPYTIRTRNSRLKCCNRGGYDTLEQAIQGNLRSQDVLEWLYLYELSRFEGYIKFGIAQDISDNADDTERVISRSDDEEYGEEICSWLFDTRLDAFLVEEALFHKTIKYQSHPIELTGWAGYLEIRKCPQDWIVDQSQFLVDHFYKVGRWQFVLDQIPLNSEQSSKVQSLLLSEN